MNTQRVKKSKASIKIREITVFSMLGTVMFCSKILMEAFPNIHLLGMLTMVYTLVFRKKALIPIYVYVFLNGAYSGFSIWWIPYLYIWTILWGITMVLPKNMQKKFSAVLYPIICGAHGLAFGALYAPAQAFLFGFNLKQTMAWIAAGLPFDVIHGIGNLFAGLLILPLSIVLSKVCKNIIPIQ